MTATVALVHSPLVGKSTWRGVARCLSTVGVRVVMPARRAGGTASGDGTGRLAAAMAPLVPEETLAQLLTDSDVRERFVTEVPRLPLSFFDEPFLGSAAWAEGIPAGYVLLSDAYRPAAEAADERGWPVARLDLHHLAPVTDPGVVATTMLSVLDALRVTLWASGPVEARPKAREPATRRDS